MTQKSAVGPVYFSGHPFGLILLLLSFSFFFFFFLGLKMPDDFHSTAIVLAFSDICLEDCKSVEYVGNETGARPLSALYVVT